MTYSNSLTAVLLSLVLTGAAHANQSEWVYRGANGRLLYARDAQGDRVPDFSDVGYQAGRQPIPSVPTLLSLSPIAGDNTAHIQAAIDLVSSLPVGADGFRGAVTLGPGSYEVGGTLNINASGVVLRGSGRDAGGTVLNATGTTQRDLIKIAGSGSQSLFGVTGQMVDKTVPVGARSFRVNSTSGFTVGDTVRVERPSTANWISDLGMDMIPPRNDGRPITQWQAGSFDLRYDRVITRIEGDRIFVDAPLTNSFELQYGGGTIRRYSWGTRIENVGVENLRAESSFTSPTDEDHAWNFVSVDDAQNVWVRDTTSAHFGRSAVLSNPGAKWLTVDNAINLTPKSQITGSRRYTFDLSGQLELVTNSEANEGRHDFVNNSTRPAGPHVFHNSVANNAIDETGPHQRWATGTLFDNIVVDGDQINARNRGNFGSGHGWAGANMVIWNSSAESYIVQNPPTAQNWLVGSTGTIIDDQTFGPQEPGYTDSHGQRVDVDSLYVSQLNDASDVNDFTWRGGVGNWSDPEAWAERLTPGAYAIEHRDYLVGDIDDFAYDGASSVDDAFIDPAWEAAISGSSAAPITGLDDTSGNKNVAFTIQHQLDAGERVVHGSLALSMKQTGGLVSTDFVRLFNSDPANRLVFSDLGWDTEVNPTTPFVGLLDLSEYTEEMQSGSINVQVNEDTAVDWAYYDVAVASPIGDSTTASVTIVGPGVALIDSDVGEVASLAVGTESAPGELAIDSEGSIAIRDAYQQTSNGKLRVSVGQDKNGRLTVHGAAALSGEFQLEVDSDYSPSAGDSFTLIQFDSSPTIDFSGVALPDIDGGGAVSGLRWSINSSDTALEAQVLLAGDYNADGVVDVADYTVWRDTLDMSDSLAADGNGDGVIDSLDYQVWVDTFGQSVSLPSTSIPEPGAALGLLLAVATCHAFVKKHLLQ